MSEADRPARGGSTNEVRLVGRVSRTPEERLLPSGDSVWSFRVVVVRLTAHAQRSGARTTVDAIDCAVWRGRARRSVAAWSADDVVEVHGELRRRFFQSEGRRVSRLEVEVARGRLIRRAGCG